MLALNRPAKEAEQGVIDIVGLLLLRRMSAVDRRSLGRYREFPTPFGRERPSGPA
jgi:hypothetical protein